MRQSIASIALIRRGQGQQTQWLAQWNRSWRCYNFVGGHKHDDESFRQCVIREVTEELEIAEGSGFAVAQQPLARLDYTAWSAGAGQQTLYVMELFEVELIGEATRRQVDADPRNRWLTEEEIRSTRCADGQPVSVTMKRILNRAKLRAKKGWLMSEQLRHKTVAVAVIYDPNHGFLLWNNPRWGGYAFPMRHLEPGDQPEQAALAALADRDFPLSLPNATARPLECLGAFGRSEGVHVDTYYDYHVIEIEPGQTLDTASMDPNVRFLPYDCIQAANMVTWSTRVIATSLVESQEVVVSVIWRRSDRGLEFLLVKKTKNGYFFPSIRRKTHGPLEGMAEQAVRFDLEYQGLVTVEYAGDAVEVHDSTRFNAGKRRYRFYVCVIQLPEVDLRQPDNPLAETMNEFQAARLARGLTVGTRGYADWFTVDEMKQSPEMSPQVAPVLPVAIAAVGEGE